MADASRGFIYAVSLTGVTGARSELAAGLEDFVNRIKHETARPVCVGFGIATPEQAKRVAAVADGVIIGSRIVQLMEEDPTGGAAARLVAGVRQAMDG